MTTKELVKLMVKHGDQARVSSRVVAEKFGKEHRHVLRAIRNLGITEEFRVCNFGQSNYLNKQGKNIDEIMMTRDGFSILAMGFTGPEAMRWKIDFINAFNAMEKALLRTIKSETWARARIQGKEVRNELTDAIQDLIEYATAQGSKNAKMYYANITNMEYKALKLLEQGSKIGENFRDTLDKFEINALFMAEQIAQHWINEGMKQGLHYKEIYQLAKMKVEQYTKSACVTYQVMSEKVSDRHI
jgi:Rha family phage regulatory protein